MHDSNFKKLPSYYWSQMDPALRYGDPKFVNSLIDELVKYGEAHVQAAEHFRDQVDKFDKDDVRDGREEMLATLRDAAVTCDELATIAGAASDALKARLAET